MSKNNNFWTSFYSLCHQNKNFLNGIYKFTVADNEVSRFDQFLSESIEGSTSGSIDFDLEWHWFKSGEIPEKRIIKTEKVKFNLPENEDFTLEIFELIDG